MLAKDKFQLESQPVAGKKIKNPRRSVCPIACTLDLIGDKWTLLVIRDLFLGKTLFKEFQSSPEGIATNILSNRLQKLVKSGLVKSVPSARKAGTVAYQLTGKGKSLESLLKEMLAWGLEHVDGTEARLLEKENT